MVDDTPDGEEIRNCRVDSDADDARDAINKEWSRGAGVAQESEGHCAPSAATAASCDLAAGSPNAGSCASTVFNHSGCQLLLLSTCLARNLQGTDCLQLLQKRWPCSLETSLIECDKCCLARASGGIRFRCVLVWLAL